MKCSVFLFICIALVTTMTHAEWSPSGEPDLRQILNEIKEDRHNGNYEAALGKHVWFHNNSLKYDESFYGVRLSYALSDWVELTKIYDPALKVLNNLSDEAENNVKTSNGCCSEAFHDFVAINRELNRNEKVVELFKWLDLNKPLIAKKRFPLAQPALIKSNEFIICGKYINPVDDLSRLQEMYTMEIKFANDPEFGEEMKEYAEKSYINGVTTLVAVLSINDRHDEALKIAETSKNKIDTKIFQVELNDALSGIMPVPWP